MPLSIPSEILWPWEIKSPIKGPAVMFDVVSASFNIIYLAAHARRLLTVTKDSVLTALEKNPSAFLVGETDDPQLFAKLKDRLIVSNSPTAIVQTDFDDKDIILITNNGTHAIADLFNKGASTVIVANYANISAVAAYLLTVLHNKTVDSRLARMTVIRKVYLIPAGGREKEFARVGGKLGEDLICALALQALLRGEKHDFDDDFRRCRESIKLQYDRIPRETTQSLIFKANMSRIIPFCFPLAPGIIEIKPKLYD